MTSRQELEGPEKESDWQQPRTHSVDALTRRKLKADKLRVNYRFGFVQFRKKCKVRRTTAVESSTNVAKNAVAEGGEGPSVTQNIGAAGKRTASKEVHPPATATAQIALVLGGPSPKKGTTK